MIGYIGNVFCIIQNRSVLNAHRCSSIHVDTIRLNSISRLYKSQTHSKTLIHSCSSTNTSENITQHNLKKHSVKVAVLLSGGGRSLQNLFDQQDANLLQGVEFTCVISSKESALGKMRAESRNIPTYVVSPKQFKSDTDGFSDRISEIFDQHQIELIVLAGWMHFYKIPQRYTNKVINIHPSLIPSFCGKGYYGEKVHQAVLQFGAKVTGCTVHFADNEYDHGAIILQRAVNVLDDDSVDSLAARVFEQEKIALAQAVQLFVNGQLQFIDERRVRIIEKE
mmetsp:Transcript_12253/g.22161  ORF Transcript_12253/g.22161 Transcript_12253/m.22161 type:complete len:280 (-) Transcript_12253:1583-2422(-)